MLGINSLNLWLIYGTYFTSFMTHTNISGSRDISKILLIININNNDNYLGPYDLYIYIYISYILLLFVSRNIYIYIYF